MLTRGTSSASSIVPEGGGHGTPATRYSARHTALSCVEDGGDDRSVMVTVHVISYRRIAQMRLELRKHRWRILRGRRESSTIWRLLRPSQLLRHHCLEVSVTVPSTWHYSNYLFFQVKGNTKASSESEYRRFTGFFRRKSISLSLDVFSSLFVQRLAESRLGQKAIYIAEKSLRVRG
jgi:hypothetical protein